MEITVTAPNRIDLAGGTTDLYPLFLLMDGGFTLNAAISVYSRVTLRSRDSGIRVMSEDLARSVNAQAPSELPIDGPLGLVGRIVRALPPPQGAEIITRNEAPRGSGLGASSALVVALIRGLLKLRSEKMDRRAVVCLGMSVETSLIGVPAGCQDHIAAVYGGMSVLEFGHQGFVRKALPRSRERLEEMVILSYTGEGRFSGMNNWEITKSFIDGTENVREKLVRIRDVARAAGRAVLSEDWAALPALVDEEWRIRKSLAPGVTTARIEAMMESARAAGAKAGKICGAGGGGCMITMVDPRRRNQVEQALTEEGGEVVPFKIDTGGLTVTSLK
jgi:D-glycero-alpha-D-manno-heptose-7-phosphate kinase